MKKVLVIIAFCALVGYLIFAAFFFKDKPLESLCNHFELLTVNTRGVNMIDLKEIEKQIDAKGLNPYGKPLKDINTFDIEQVVLSNKMVKKGNAFITSNGSVRVEIEERQPILRIISSLGDNYYIDNDGESVPLSKSFVGDLPLATGTISEGFAKTELHKFAVFLSTNEFWDNQIEQIVVLPGEEIKLIPRIGNHEIILGKLDGFQEKLNKLKTFYEKGLSEVGWNRYSVLNLKYDKQVVGTKR